MNKYAIKFTYRADIVRTGFTILSLQENELFVEIIKKKIVLSMGSTEILDIISMNLLTNTVH